MTTTAARPLILVGNARTGTTLLTTLLLQHPDVHMHGELFHPVENERRGSHALRGRARPWFDPRHDDALEFLDAEVFNVPVDYRGRPVKVVGFKYLAESTRPNGGADFLRRLRAHYPHASILHMVRNNHLEVLISHQLAQRRSQWVSWIHAADESREVAPFSIPIQEAYEYFERLRTADANFAEVFQGPGYLQVEYQDLVDNPGPTMARVWGLLGVSPIDASPVTRKQVADRDLVLIKNLSELRKIYESCDLESRDTSETVQPMPTQFDSAKVDVPSFILRLAARGHRPQAIATKLHQRGFATTMETVESVVDEVRADLPRWLNRPLHEEYPVVIQFGALANVVAPSPEGDRGASDAPMPMTCAVAIGITNTGLTEVLGIWSDPDAVGQLRKRGLKRIGWLIQDPALGQSPPTDSQVEIGVFDTDTLSRIELALAAGSRQEKRERASQLRTELTQAAQRIGVPPRICGGLLRPLHIQGLINPYRQIAARRVPWRQPRKLVKSLALHARSLDPSGHRPPHWTGWESA